MSTFDLSKGNKKHYYKTKALIKEDGDSFGTLTCRPSMWLIVSSSSPLKRTRPALGRMLPCAVDPPSWCEVSLPLGSPLSRSGAWWRHVRDSPAADILLSGWLSGMGIGLAGQSRTCGRGDGWNRREGNHLLNPCKWVVWVILVEQWVLLQPLIVLLGPGDGLRFSEGVCLLFFGSLLCQSVSSFSQVGVRRNQLQDNCVGYA